MGGSRRNRRPSSWWKRASHRSRSAGQSAGMPGGSPSFTNHQLRRTWSASQDGSACTRIWRSVRPGRRVSSTASCSSRCSCLAQAMANNIQMRSVASIVWPLLARSRHFPMWPVSVSARPSRSSAARKSTSPPIREDRPAREIGAHLPAMDPGRSNGSRVFSVMAVVTIALRRWKDAGKQISTRPQRLMPRPLAVMHNQASWPPMAIEDCAGTPCQ